MLQYKKYLHNDNSDIVSTITLFVGCTFASEANGH